MNDTLIADMRTAKYHCATCGDGFGESTKHLLKTAGDKQYCGKPGCLGEYEKQAKQPRKWQISTTDIPGRIQVGKVQKALNHVRHFHHEYTEISGIVEKPETHKRWGYFEVFGVGNRADVTEAQNTIGERYGYTVSRENANQIVKDCEAASVELEKNPTIRDKRITQAEHDETERANAVSKEKYEREEAARKEREQAQRLANPLGSVAYNREHNGVEIAFTDKPDDSLRYSLKRAGFRITRRPPWKWYQKFSREAWASACRLAGVSTPCPLDAEGNPNGNHADKCAGGYVAAQEAAFEDNMAVAAGVFNEMAGA